MNHYLFVNYKRERICSQPPLASVQDAISSAAMRGVTLERECSRRDVERIASSRETSSVGVVVGTSGAASKDFIHALVPAPPLDGGSDAQTLRTVDVDWCAEHARQLARALPGGTRVLGVFACGFDGELRDAETTLRGLRSEVARAALEASVIDEGEGGGGGGDDDFILLAIDRATKRLRCRRGINLARIEVGDCGERLKNFVTVEAKYDLDVSVAVRGDLRSSVERALVEEQRRIMRSSVVVEGDVIDPECAVVVTDRGWRSDGRAEFLCAPRCEATKEVDDANNDDGDDGGGDDDGVPMVRIAGTVHARAVVYSRDSCGRAASELTGDAARSIAARWHALLDSADDDALKNDESTNVSSPLSTGFTPSSSSVVIHLPQRVFVPWIENAPASDYVEETETESDVFARIHQIFAVDRLQPDAIQRVERPSGAQTSSSNRHRHTKMSTAGAGSVRASQPPKPLSVCVIAAFAILIAVLISYHIIPHPLDFP